MVPYVACREHWYLCVLDIALLAVTNPHV
jgi:hypothetical protein